jgi:hypothetical protein
MYSCCPPTRRIISGSGVLNLFNTAHVAEDQAWLRPSRFALLCRPGSEKCSALSRTGAFRSGLATSRCRRMGKAVAERSGSASALSGSRQSSACTQYSRAFLRLATQANCGFITPLVQAGPPNRASGQGLTLVPDVSLAAPSFTAQNRTQIFPIAFLVLAESRRISSPKEHFTGDWPAYLWA